jgi:hypothetical protein
LLSIWVTFLLPNTALQEAGFFFCESSEGKYQAVIADC